MKKRIVHLLMVGFLACALVGCGGQQETNAPNADQQTTTESTSTTESASAPTEESTEPPHEHAYTEAVTTEAACETDGVKTFTCECGDSYTEAITATGHNYEEVADSAVLATCDTDGKEADTKCSLCENVISGAVIPATGHSYGKYTYNKDATTKADGTETATCSACGDKTTRTKEGSKLSYEGYDEFGNGYIVGADGYKYFDADCPYPIFEPIWLSDQEVIYYGPSRWPQLINSLAEEMSQKNGIYGVTVASGATELGYYNGEFVLRERIYVK